MKVFYSAESSDDGSPLLPVGQEELEIFEDKYQWILRQIQELFMPPDIYLKIWKNDHNSLTTKFSGLGCHVFLSRGKNLPDIRLSAKPIVLRASNVIAIGHVKKLATESLKALYGTCDKCLKQHSEGDEL